MQYQRNFSDMSQETSVENFENSDALFMRNQLDRLEQKYASARMTCKLYVNRIPVFVLFFSKQIFAGFGFWYAIDIINVFITIKDPLPRVAKCQCSPRTPNRSNETQIFWMPLSSDCCIPLWNLPPCFLFGRRGWGLNSRCFSFRHCVFVLWSYRLRAVNKQELTHKESGETARATSVRGVWIILIGQRTVRKWALANEKTAAKLFP